MHHSRRRLSPIGHLPHVHPNCRLRRPNRYPPRLRLNHRPMYPMPNRWPWHSQLHRRLMRLIPMSLIPMSLAPKRLAR